MAKSQKKDKNNILLNILAIIVFAGIILVVVFIYDKKLSQSYAPQIVAFGDSLFAQHQGDDSVMKLVAEQTGIDIADCSMGGTGMAYRDTQGLLGNTDDMFCMASLADAVCSKNFATVNNAKSTSIATGYFEDRIDLLKRIDFDNVQLVIIEQCLNDYQGAVPLYSGADAENPYTYLGALRKVINQFKETYPDAKIVVVSPTFAWYVLLLTDCEERDFGYGNLESFVNAQQELLSELGVDYIDIYHDFYEHDDINIAGKYTTDGMHPNELGRQMIADAISEWCIEKGYSR